LGSKSVQREGNFKTGSVKIKQERRTKALLPRRNRTRKRRNRKATGRGDEETEVSGKLEKRTKTSYRRTNCKGRGEGCKTSKRCSKRIKEWKNWQEKKNPT